MTKPSPSGKPFYLGIIPARGGSKRVPGKNIRTLGGIPLIAYTIKAAAGSTRLGRTVVSTDSEQIAGIAREWGGDVPFLRPTDIAGDTSLPIDTILHAIRVIEADERRVDAVVLLQPTSPMRTAGDIDAALGIFESTRADTVTAVCRAREHPYYAWRPDSAGIKPFFSMREMTLGRNELPEALVENGSIFIVRRPVVDRRTLYGEVVVPYTMDARSSVDIDTAEDMLIAEMYLSEAEKP
jgi:CMP-N-acetylneuraminic acid synthetase